VFEASLRGTDPNLADLGRYVVRVSRTVLRPDVRLVVRTGVAGQPVRNVCGVLAGATGVKPGAALVDREEVNTGTIPGPPFPRSDPGSWRVGVIAHQ
jgi:hypothetical protein